MQFHYLGRRYAPDVRDARYRLTAITKKDLLGWWKRNFGSKMWKTGPVLNQGSSPQCVGYSWAGFIQAEPMMTTDGPAPTAIYDLAQQNDEWPGPPPEYDGSSVRGGAKALTILGKLANYHWATSATEVRDYVLSTGTVVVGTNWLYDMFMPASDGYLRVSGSVAGGHAWHIVGYSGIRKAFRMQNSWGADWGEKGQAWIKLADLQRLLDADGEACAAVEK